MNRVVLTLKRFSLTENVSFALCRDFSSARGQNWKGSQAQDLYFLHTKVFNSSLNIENEKSPCGNVTQTTSISKRQADKFIQNLFSETEFLYLSKEIVENRLFTDKFNFGFC